MPRAERRDRIAEIMNEHIRLLGCPDIIVTRQWAYEFFVSIGFKAQGSTHEFLGFRSADYMSIGQPTVDLPLTDLSEEWASSIVDAIARA